MLSTLQGRVTNLKESIGGVKETLKVVEGCTNDLDLMREQLKDYVAEALSSNRDVMMFMLSWMIRPRS